MAQPHSFAPASSNASTSRTSISSSRRWGGVEHDDQGTEGVEHFGSDRRNLVAVQPGSNRRSVRARTGSIRHVIRTNKKQLSETNVYRIDGSGGNDTICALQGDDQISGGDGLDRVFAGGGNDLVIGGSGNDLLSGGPGNDRIQGVLATIDFSAKGAEISLQEEPGTMSSGVESWLTDSLETLDGTNSLVTKATTCCAAALGWTR